MTVVDISAPTSSISVQNESTTSPSLLNRLEFHLRYSLGLNRPDATSRDLYTALGLALRERLIDRMRDTAQRHGECAAKRVYYISMEFLIGKSLENNLVNMGLLDECRQTLADIGLDLNDLLDCEPDAGLGNGGLGRLAACFIDSMATLDIAGYGYGINYEYGLFRQGLSRQQQREFPDNWLTFGSPWQVERSSESVVIPLYGRVDYETDRDGNAHPMWVDWQAVVGVPHDMPVVGYGGKTVNFLRLFSARGSQEFDMEVFNAGDYVQAVDQKIRAETISKVLYPSDAVAQGKELRLIQEYFLVACTIRDLIRRFERDHGNNFALLPNFVAIQLNDTHPALAVPELMRLLIDEKDLSWDEAWGITVNTLAYTNHTLLPEALEKWSAELVGRVLPRHLQIIYEINRRHLEEVSDRWPEDSERQQRMSLIEEGDDKQVRMCNLAIVGSHSVNGVSAMHSELVKETLVPDFHEMFPTRFNNKTNGITQRRWLVQCNPGLVDLVNDCLGSGWVTNLDELRGLEQFVGDGGVQDRFLRVKTASKVQLADIIKRDIGVTVNPQSLFDVQVKRIHEYKRQLLNALRIMHEVIAIKEDGWVPTCPRTYIFAGKAAPGYWTAKQIISLICSIGDVVNRDPQLREHLQVVFLPNYRVSLAERIFPASDISEQISTAGYEASGTGNMKFMLNGAITLGTLDGANIEIREEVGDDNIFTFGLNSDEVQWSQVTNSYKPIDCYNSDSRIRRVVDALNSERFSPGDATRFNWVRDYLLSPGEQYFHLADLASYLDVQQEASNLYVEPNRWAEKALLNVARAGKFSSDRTIREYASEIWRCL